MDVVLLAGSANPELGDSIAAELGVRPAVRLERHPDGEVLPELKEDAGGRDVFVLQSLFDPVGERLLEMLLLADAARRAGARRVLALVPYLGYARQERRSRPSTPIGARVIADLLSTRFDRVVALDLHAPALEGFFSIPLEHLTASRSIAADLAADLPQNAVVVSPDLGAAKLAEEYGRILRLPFAVVHKTRATGREVTAHGVMGDVRGRRPIVVDDMISTGATIVEAARALLEAGCRPELTVAATHLLLIGPSVERLAALPLARLVGTDSLPKRATPFPLHISGVGPLLAEAARRLHLGRSLEGLLATR